MSKAAIETARSLGKKGSATTAKVAMAYASYNKTRALAKQIANQVAHEWKIQNDYDEGMYEAGVQVAADHEVQTPGVRRKLVTGQSYGEADRFSSTTWVNLRGVGAVVQARKPTPDTIEFRAFRVKDLEKLQAKVRAVRDETNQSNVDIEFNFEPVSRTRIYGWDAENKMWDFTKERSSRSFQSVLIPNELQSDIEADLKAFTESRDRMTRLEMPWRRGYLLSGPPGTGKTSLSLAIAGALRFNLLTLSLTDMASDGTLRKAVSSLPARSVLVIEDIDANSVSHERDHNAAQDGALSLSGLLNSLDGFETPDGLVTILTTNHIEKLDAALTRSGRMDRTFHLGHIEATELERLFAWFYEQPVPSPAPELTGAVGMSPADVSELFKQNLDDPAAGWQAVLDRINDNTKELVA